VPEDNQRVMLATVRSLVEMGHIGVGAPFGQQPGGRIVNYYPEALKAIIAYLEALNAAEKVVGDGENLPYPAEIKMTDNYGTDWGVLRDEIGGAWSWFPPEAAAKLKAVGTVKGVSPMQPRETP
jgi:hypothetical protein